MTQDEILTMAENAELVVSKHSVWTPEKKDFTFMGHTVEGDLANLMQFAALVASAERKECEKIIWNADDWIGSDAKIWLVKSIQEERGQA